MFWLVFINTLTVTTLHRVSVILCMQMTLLAQYQCPAQLMTTYNLSVQWGIDWSAEHKMTLNLDKTKAMLIKFSPNTSVPTVFSPVDIVTEWKFLGVIIDQYLSFNSHVAYVVQKAQKRYSSLLQLKRMSVETEKLSHVLHCPY